MSSIICVGDFGTGEEGQYKVSKLMEYLIEKNRCKFILGLGDNIYPDGVKSIYDQQFIDKFEKPYNNLSNKIKFYNVLGNHDYHIKSSPKSEINYSAISKKWILPNNFYCFKKIINSIPIEFIAIDTNFNRMSKSNKQLQEKWILNTLYDSNARYNIIFGHHPWKSFGQHGDCDDELDLFYNKISQTNKVDLIISGHDHNQQHIFIPNKPNMIISGVGGKTRDMPHLKLQNELKFSSSNLGCCMIEFNKKYLTVNFYNINKIKEYSVNIHKIK